MRSLNLPDRDSALAVAGRGKEAGNIDFLVGQSNVRSTPAVSAEPKHADDDTGSRSVPYHAAEITTLPRTLIGGRRCLLTDVTLVVPELAPADQRQRDARDPEAGLPAYWAAGFVSPPKFSILRAN